MLSFSQKYQMFAKKLGEGGGGVVYEGKEKATGNKVAIKLIRKSRSDESANQRLLQEVEVLRLVSKLHHKYIMSLLDFYEEAFRFILVLQYVPGGDLFDRIVSKNRYSEEDARCLLTELCEAVSALHKINVLHRDIKPENVLMTTIESDSEIVLGDFGLAIITDKEVCEDNVGTLQYRAPEIFLKRPHFTASDVWSIGAVLFVLLSGAFPFDDADEAKVADKITTGVLHFPNAFFKDVSIESIDLIKNMLTVNPTQRYTIDDVMKHPWMLKGREELMARTLYEALERMKLYDGSRKFKAAAVAVRGAVRMHLMKKRKRPVGDNLLDIVATLPGVSDKLLDGAAAEEDEGEEEEEEDDESMEIEIRDASSTSI